MLCTDELASEDKENDRYYDETLRTRPPDAMEPEPEEEVKQQSEGVGSPLFELPATPYVSESGGSDSESRQPTTSPPKEPAVQQAEEENPQEYPEDNAVEDDHFEIVDPATPPWKQVTSLDLKKAGTICFVLFCFCATPKMSLCVVVDEQSAFSLGSGVLADSASNRMQLQMRVVVITSPPWGTTGSGHDKALSKEQKLVKRFHFTMHNADWNN